MPNAKIEKYKVADFIEKSYKIYGKYVNTERAIPDFRDGLQPVQRRILWSMYGLQLFKKFAKSAKTIGYTLGNYHPHGDQACYGSMINMTHEKYPLVVGRGNCGTHIDSAAAYRYTEARLSSLYPELFKYIGIAEFMDTFDGSDTEPVFIPALLPFLFLNGNFGVGFGEGNVCSVPPHRLSEILSAVVKRINGATDTEVLNSLTGPDYGLRMGNLISSTEEIAELYRNGNGTLKYLCTYKFSTIRRQPVFIITSWVPRFGYNTLLKKCKAFVDNKYLDYIIDNSAGDKIEIEIGYKDINVIYSKVLPLLQTFVTYNFKILDSKTKEFSSVTFLEYLDLWIAYRKDSEKLFWEKELIKKLEVYNKQKTLLNVFKNRIRIIKILKKYTGKELNEQLILFGDPAVIKAISLGELSKDKKQKIKNTLKKLKIGVEGIEDNLKNIDKLLIKYFKTISSKYKEDRQMGIIEKPVYNIEETEQSYYVAVSKSGKFAYDLKNKFKSQGTWDFIFKSSGKFIVFYPNNIAKIYDILKTKSLDIGFVSVISDKVDAIIVLDGKGNYLPLKNFSNSPKTAQMVFKDDRNIDNVYGLYKQDTLYVSTNAKVKHRTKEYKIADMNLTRPRTAPKILLKWGGANVKVRIVRGEHV